MILFEIIQVIGILLFSVMMHECAHGWIAFKLGDPTAKYLGRLTLNPLKHIDPLGTIVVPLILKLIGAPVLGWAKPVPVNFQMLRNPKKDMAWVALSGPMTNFMIAFVFSRLLFLELPLPALKFVTLAVLINLVLAVFNLIPIPPLDGSRILISILPNHLARSYEKLEPYGFIIVLVLLNFGAFKIVWTIVGIMSVLLGINLSILT